MRRCLYATHCFLSMADCTRYDTWRMSGKVYKRKALAPELHAALFKVRDSVASCGCSLDSDHGRCKAVIEDLVGGSVRHADYEKVTCTFLRQEAVQALLQGAPTMPNAGAPSHPRMLKHNKEHLTVVLRCVAERMVAGLL